MPPDKVYLVVGFLPGHVAQGPDRPEEPPGLSFAIAMRVTQTPSYENVKRLVGLMVKYIRKYGGEIDLGEVKSDTGQETVSRINFGTMKPRAVEEFIEWYVYEADPMAFGGYPKYSHQWDRYWGTV